MTTPNVTINDGLSGRATASPKPGPRLNALHAQILTSLLDNKPHQLAGNMSEFNINVLAKRWMP